MQLLKGLGSQKQESKSLLLETVKNLSYNLAQLKNSLGNLLPSNSDKVSFEIQKLCDIHTKQTVIMNKIRLGMEKEHSDSNNALAKVQHSPQKGDSVPSPNIKELEYLFNQQAGFERDRVKYLTSMTNSLQQLAKIVQTRVTEQGPRDDLSLQFEELIEQLKTSINTNHLEKWAGNLYVSIISRSYEEHIKGNQSFDDTKMELSYAILSYYQKFVLRLSKEKFDQATIEKILQRFQRAGSRAISYLLTKCPMSKQTIDVSIFERLLNIVDESKHPEYDVLHQLGISFDPNEFSIGPTLKKLVGELIQEVNRFFPDFKLFFQEVIDGVDKVDTKGGFTYSIERKIMQGVGKYTEEEIITPGFFTKSNELIRTITKWVEYLITPFEDPSIVVRDFHVFRSSQGLERLNHKEREHMAEKFQKKRGKLEDILNSMNLFLQRTIWSIIAISNNPLGSNKIQQFPFLEENASSLLLICRYIWKTIEGFANQVLRQVLKLYDQIREQYLVQNRREAQLNLYGFFVEDLLSCECKGSKDAILYTYDKLLQKQKEGQIKILKVSNNLLRPSQNIIILFKHKGSYLTTEMSLHLTGKKGHEKDQFNRFLRQLSITILRPTFMLASTLINLNPVKQYLRKYKPYFKPNSKTFVYDPKAKDVVCQKHPETPLKEGVVYNSFVCNSCFLFIESYAHFFPRKQCAKCLFNICSVCQLSLLPPNQAFEYLLSPVSRVTDYFTPLELYKYKQSNWIRQKVAQHLRQNEYDYLLVVGYKNGTNRIELALLKSLIHHNQQLVLANFTNEIYDFKKIDGSLVVLLKPTHPICISPVDTLKYEKLYSIQDDLQKEKEGEPKPSYIELESKDKQVRMIIDYHINKASTIRQLISKTAIEGLIARQNKTHEGKLSFDRLIINFDLFKKLSAPEEILVLDISECELDTTNNLSEFNMFKNLQQIFVSNTPSFSYKEFSFNNEINSISITECDLSNFEFDFPKLKELRLIKNKLTANFLIKNLPKVHTLKLCQNEINSFWNLGSCELPAVIRIDLKCNNIAEPLPVLKFPKLRVLDLSQNEISDISNITKCSLALLKQLCLSYNKLTVLPDFSNLEHLQVLKLAHNNIESIEGRKHDNLEILDLSFNNLTELPPLDYTNLTRVSFKHNQITDFSELKPYRLSSIEVQFNPIEKGKLPLPKFTDSLRVHPGILQMNLNPRQMCNTKQQLNCSKCSKGIKVIRFYENASEVICQECYNKRENKEEYRQVYRLDGDIMNKYS